MAALIFLFWVSLNGRLTAEIALFGLAVSAALYVFAWRCLDYKPRYDLVALKSLPLAAAYGAALGIWPGPLLDAVNALTGLLF